jgi:hypothetical protein
MKNQLKGAGKRETYYDTILQIHDVIVCNRNTIKTAMPDFVNRKKTRSDLLGTERVVTIA